MAAEESALHAVVAGAYFLLFTRGRGFRRAVRFAAGGGRRHRCQRDANQGETEHG